MKGVNYLLLLEGNSDSAGPESSVRGFSKLEAAQAAMMESYKGYAAALNIPVRAQTFSNQYTTRMKNGIRLERYGDWFEWKIVDAVPEDGDSDNTPADAKSQQQFEMERCTVVIEEHTAQEFTVNAYDLFHAVQIGEEEYKKGSFVVQPATPNARLIMARNDETGEVTEWKEF